MFHKCYLMEALNTQATNNPGIPGKWDKCSTTNNGTIWSGFAIFPDFSGSQCSYTAYMVRPVPNITGNSTK